MSKIKHQRFNALHNNLLDVRENATENTGRKGENADYLHFFLFSQCFQMYYISMKKKKKCGPT